MTKEKVTPSEATFLKEILVRKKSAERRDMWYTVWLASHYSSVVAAWEAGSDYKWGLLPIGLLRKWKKNTYKFIPPCHSSAHYGAWGEKGEKYFSLTCGFQILLHTLALCHKRILLWWKPCFTFLHLWYLLYWFLGQDGSNQ